MRTGLLIPALLVMVLAVAVPRPVPADATAADQDAVRVMLVSIDALDPAHLDDVGDDGTPMAPTLVALREQGTWWEQARGVMSAETLPNHVAMATGTYPGTNGIPGNEGRLEAGDDAVADPDLGIQEAREATSIIAAVEDQCSDLRTVTSLSKEYVWRTFEGEADADFDQPSANIPVSGHAPESATVPYILDQEQEAPVDLLFANLGDNDRAGHVDETGAVLAGPDTVTDGPRLFQRTVLAQTDTWMNALVTQLQSNGEWERTVLLLVSDHRMNWTIVGDERWNIDVGAVLEQVETDNDRDPGSTFLFSDNGGAGFVYLIDPDDADRETLLEQAHDAIAAMDGVEDLFYRLPAPFDADGLVLSEEHSDWRMHETPRTGDILVLAEERHRMGSVSTNPIPGNHGHTTTRHTTALVTGGWDGIMAGQVIAASDPDAIDQADDTAALPEQAEQVDWAPTIGWLLGVEDPGVAAGGAPQWQGRVLGEAFERQPGTLVCSGETTRADGGGTGDDGADDAADDAADDGRDLAATGAGTALLGAIAIGVAVAAGRRRRE